MKIFLSASEASPDKRRALLKIIEQSNEQPPLLWNLMSYYYLRSNIEYAEKIRDSSRLVLIDSGAHSFQKGTRVNWDEFTHEYAAFIRKFDRPNVLGYFEMDVDNILGLGKVLELRRILETESGHSDKIIPVWHKGRGIRQFIEECESHSGKIISVTGFKNEDILDDQYPMFVKKARVYKCKVHCLGMTRKKILDAVPFDFVDSSSWAQKSIFGKVGDSYVSKEFSKINRDDVFIANYREAMEDQMKYFRKWRKVCEDEF